MTKRHAWVNSTYGWVWPDPVVGTLTHSGSLAETCLGLLVTQPVGRQHGYGVSCDCIQLGMEVIQGLLVGSEGRMKMKGMMSRFFG
jgi:hypothetical protein